MVQDQCWRFLQMKPTIQSPVAGVVVVVHGVAVDIAHIAAVDTLVRKVSSRNPAAVAVAVYSLAAVAGSARVDAAADRVVDVASLVTTQAIPDESGYEILKACSFAWRPREHRLSKACSLETGSSTGYELSQVLIFEETHGPDEGRGGHVDLTLSFEAEGTATRVRHHRRPSVVADAEAAAAASHGFFAGESRPWMAFEASA